MNSRTSLIGTAIALIVAAAGGTWWFTAHSAPAPTIDLIEFFPDAEKGTNAPTLEAAFAVEDVTINGQSRRVIYMHPTSRAVWSVIVPKGGALRTWIALKPEAWDAGGDGVQFRVGVSDGERSEELMRRHVDPHRSPGDRRWVPVNLDLSPYAGRPVKLTFNTDPSVSAGQGDPHYDWAIWGDPEILQREITAPPPPGRAESPDN